MSLKRGFTFIELIYINFRRFKSVDMVAFRDDISSSELTLQPAADAEDLCSLYTSVLSDLIDTYAPLLSCSVSVRPLVPWYNQEMREAKQLRRWLERRWRRTGLIVHQGSYRAQCSTVKSITRNAKREYFTNELKQCDSDQKAFFRL